MIWLTLLSLSIIRFVLTRRYRIKINGIDQLEGQSQRTLIIANHPSLIDPAIIISHFWPRFKFRPMIINEIPFWLKPWARLLNPIFVSQFNKKERKEALEKAISSLKEDKSIYMCPAGQPYTTGLESLGSVRGLTKILQEVPDIKILLLRVEGLWGSQFSSAATGKFPIVYKVLFSCVSMLLLNLIFFIPKRDIEITFKRIDKDNLPPLEIEQINRFFENEFNPDRKTEKFSLVPKYFWKRPKKEKKC